MILPSLHRCAPVTARADKGLKDAILKLEKRILTERDDLKSKANEIVKAER